MSGVYSDLIRKARSTDEGQNGSGSVISDASVSDSQLGQSVELIPIASIYRPKQQRLYFDHKEVEKLRQSMKDNGFRGSILVSVLAKDSPFRSEGYEYELVYGETRIIAWEELENDHIPSEVKVLDAKSIRRLRFDENMVRKNLNPFEEIRGYLELMGDEGSCSIESVEQELNALNNSRRGEPLSAAIEARVDVYQSVLDRYNGGKLLTFRTKLIKFRSLPDDIREALNDGKIPASQALELGSIKDDSDRASLLSWVVEDQPPVSELRKEKKRLKEHSPLDSDKSELGDRASVISKRLQKLAKGSIPPKKAKIITQIEDLLDKLESE